MKTILLKIIIPSEYSLMFLRSFALILIICLVYLIYIVDNKFDLIAPLGILISALLASFAVILNINSNIKIKQHEFSDKTRYVFFTLCLVKMYLVILDNEKKRALISFMDCERIFDTFDNINKILSEINTKDIVSIICNDILADVHYLKMEIITRSTPLKSLRASMIRPQFTNEYTPLLNNPLLEIDFRIQSCIDKLTNILSYLKYNYPKEFKTDGNLEACADYVNKNRIK